MTYVITAIICFLIISFLLPTFEGAGHLEQGCYLRDALVPYVDCVGFFGHRIAYYILNLPFYLIIFPVFATEIPWLLPLAILVWAPFLHVAWHIYLSLTVYLKVTAKKK